MFAASPETVREQILSVIELIAASIIEPDIKRFTSIIVTGIRTGRTEAT